MWTRLADTSIPVWKRIALKCPAMCPTVSASYRKHKGHNIRSGHLLLHCNWFLILNSFSFIQQIFIQQLCVGQWHSLCSSAWADQEEMLNALLPYLFYISITTLIKDQFYDWSIYWFNSRKNKLKSSQTNTINKKVMSICKVKVKK